MTFDEIQTVEDAFNSVVTPKDLNGIELQPFSLLRKNAAYQLGLSGRKEDVFADAIIVTWLMTRTDRQVAAALRDKEKAVIDAFQWAEENRFDKDENRSLIELLNRTMKEIEQSADVEPGLENGTDEKNDGRPPAI
jgi:hypothetical protein